MLSSPSKDVRGDTQFLPRIEVDATWSAVERVLASRHFSKSERLSAFLLYICRCTLENRSEEITEQQIGMNVFGRRADYNPGDDNIVRTTARQLRQRLALYYQEDGSDNEIRIEVPRGGYHPSFLSTADKNSFLPEAQVEATPSAAIAPSALQHPTDSNLPNRWSSWAVGLAVVCGVVLALAGQQLLGRFGAHPKAPTVFWSLFFAPGKPTVFVPGDAGLNMYNNLARTQVKLSDYASGTYLLTPAAQPPNGYTWASLATRRYVSWVDLTLADRIRQLAYESGARYSVEFARDVRPEDLRNSNIILVGAPTYNPWVEMFDNHLNFYLHYDGQRNSMSVLNGKPQKGEPTEFLPTGDDPTRRGYTHGFGYIALTSNLEGNGRVLLVEGSTVAGVDAALSFLMNDAKMKPILMKATKAGSLGNFEVLLSANFLRSSSPDAEILATRYYAGNDVKQD